jgi:hypothetical protein
MQKNCQEQQCKKNSTGFCRKCFLKDIVEERCAERLENLFGKEASQLYFSIKKGLIMDLTVACTECNKKTFNASSAERFVNYKFGKAFVCRSCLSSGIKNPMFGKSLNSLWTEKYGAEEALKKSETKLIKFKESTKNHNFSRPAFKEKNGMYGKTVYYVWLDKFGKEEADKRYEDMIKKMSATHQGKNNSMYGKSPKYTAGLGHACKYKNHYFRSLLELSYFIKVIERFNLKWESGEIHKWRVSYIDSKGESKTYASDFIIANKYMVEIKPKFALKNKEVQLKIAAAKKFCKENGLIYKIRTPFYIDIDRILDLYKSGSLTLEGRNKKRFEERFNVRSYD